MRAASFGASGTRAALATAVTRSGEISSGMGYSEMDVRTKPTG
jgi:hypothetical protein